MNALNVVLDHLALLADIPYSRSASLPVASTAKGRDIGRKDRRGRVGFGEYAVGPVAFFAAWSVGILPAEELAMDALPILLSWFGMAGSAVNRF